MKPFRIAPQVTFGRDASGRYTKLTSTSPPQVLAETLKGVPLNDAIRAARVPDRETGEGAPNRKDGESPIYPDSIPWPVVGSDRKPFKV